MRKPAKSSCDVAGSHDQTTANQCAIKNAVTVAVESAEMDQKSISELIRFFKLLDKWDHEVTIGKIV